VKSARQQVIQFTNDSAQVSADCYSLQAKFSRGVDIGLVIIQKHDLCQLLQNYE
jgi:hypothetical protein